MTTTMQGSEMFAQMTGRAVEAFSMFAEANQKIMRDLVDLSASTAKEGVRLYAELSSSAVEALKESQSCLLRRQGELQEVSRDPFSVYQKGILESVEGAQKAFRMLETNAQAMTRTAERPQLLTERGNLVPEGLGLAGSVGLFLALWFRGRRRHPACPSDQLAEHALRLALARHDSLEVRLHRLLHEVLPRLAVLD